MSRDRRVLPHNLDAEASILGGVLLRNEVLTQLDTLEVEDFYDMRHKIVFGAIRALDDPAFWAERRAIARDRAEQVGARCSAIVDAYEALMCAGVPA